MNSNRFTNEIIAFSFIKSIGTCTRLGVFLNPYIFSPRYPHPLFSFLYIQPNPEETQYGDDRRTMGASDVGSGNKVGDVDGTREGVPVSNGRSAVGKGVSAGKMIAVTVDVKAACG